MISVYLFCRLLPLNALRQLQERVLGKYQHLILKVQVPFAAMEMDHIRIANKKTLEGFVEDYFPPR